MKIAIFSDTFYPELGGIADSILSLSKGLANLGNEVNFYVPKYSRANFELAHRKYEEPDLGPGIKITRLNSIPFPIQTRQERITLFNPGIIKKIGEWGPDIIHSQLFWSVGLLALKTAKNLKKPIIGTNHMAISEFSRYAPLGLKSAGNLLIKYTVWYYSKCDFVTAPSNSVFEEMGKLGFNKPHTVISNPIEIGNYHPVSSDEEQKKLKNQFGLHGPVITYAGRLAAEKNIDVLIKAMPAIKRLIPNAELVIAGHGVQEKELKTLVRNFNLTNSVKFTGMLDQSKLADLYRASDIFAIASTSETQNMTMMQAMATSLPVIGVRARALPEYLNRNNGFVVEPGDSQALAEKAVMLLADSNLRHEIGKNGLGFVQSFSPEKIAEAWQNIYQDTITSY